MRTLLAVAVASIAFATGAFAQSSHVHRGAVVQDSNAPTEISRLCGVDYAIRDPDLNVQLELRRECNAGLEGGAD